MNLSPYPIVAELKSYGINLLYISLFTQEMIRYKWGVGRLISECRPRNLPIVVPIYHLGMDTVLPNKRPYIPR